MTELKPITACNDSDMKKLQETAILVRNNANYKHKFTEADKPTPSFTFYGIASGYNLPVLPVRN